MALKRKTQKLTHRCASHAELTGSIGNTGITCVTCKSQKYHLLTGLLTGNFKSRDASASKTKS